MKTNKPTTDDGLNEFATLLHENGFEIIVPRKPGTWFHFFKDGEMGSVSKSYYGGYDFCSIHKPCKEIGSGLCIYKGTELTLKNAYDALNRVGWMNDRKTLSKIKKYNSSKEYIASSSILNKG